MTSWKPQGRRRGFVTVTVEIFPDVEELEVVFCPVCKSPDPYHFDADEAEEYGHGYQCQSCGAQFIITSGPLEAEED